MSQINEYLQKIKTAIYGEEVRNSIHDAIEQCYEDAGNLAQTNQQAAASAGQAAQLAQESSQRAEIAAVNATNAQNAANEVKAELQTKLASGYWQGERGAQGEQGEQGLSGVVAPVAGMFGLQLDSQTGDLSVVYEEQAAVPSFHYDEGTGNLYYMMEEE